MKRLEEVRREGVVVREVYGWDANGSPVEPAQPPPAEKVPNPDNGHGAADEFPGSDYP